MSTKGVLIAFPSGTPRSSAASRDSAGARLAFPDLYTEYARFVWRSLRLLGVAPECLEDSVQDTFAIVARQLSSFEGRAALSTWIFGIAQRVAANQRRSHRRKRAALEPLAGDLPSDQPDPRASAEAAEAALAIEQFCAQLDDERRRLFILALLEGIPAPDIAAADNIPINTLYSRIRSLRVQLKEHLERREQAAVPRRGEP